MLDLPKQRLMGRRGRGSGHAVGGSAGRWARVERAGSLGEDEDRRGFPSWACVSQAPVSPAVTGRTAPAHLPACLPACLAGTLQNQSSSAFKLWVLVSQAGAVWPRTQTGMLRRGKEARGTGDGAGLRTRSLSLHEKLLCACSVSGVCGGRQARCGPSPVALTRCHGHEPD